MLVVSLLNNHTCGMSAKANRTFECEQCHRGFKTTKAYRNHCLTGHGDGKVLRWSAGMPLHCSSCSMTFPSRDSMRGHEKLVHETSFDGIGVELPCKRCPLSFGSAYDLSLHIVTTHDNPLVEEKAIVCESCGVVSPTRRLHRTHFRHVHEQHPEFMARPFPCPNCGIRYATKKGLDIHFSRGHPVVVSAGDFQCRICSKSFNTHRQFQFHKTRAHRARSDDRADKSLRLTCAKCGDKYAHKRGLEYHEMHHHSSSPYHWKCGVCPARFLNRTELVNHTDQDHSVLADEKVELHQQEATLLRELENDGKLDSSSQVMVRRMETSQLNRYATGYSSAVYIPPGRVYLFQESTRSVIQYSGLLKSFGSSVPYWSSEKRASGLISTSVVSVFNQEVGQDERNDEDNDDDEGYEALAAQLDDLHEYGEFPDKELVYLPGNPLPTYDYIGRLTIPMWARKEVEVIINESSIHAVSGDCFHIFEIPKDLVESVCFRIAPEKTYFVIRYGPCLGFFANGIPPEFITSNMMEGNDYSLGRLGHTDAVGFLLSDLYLGNVRNTVQHRIHSNFLW